MMRAVIVLTLLAAAAHAMDYGTWYKDDASQHACFFRGDTAVTTHVAFNKNNWPSSGGWAGKAVCGTCFVVSCDDSGNTYGIPGSASCGGKSVISQLTNECPECASGGGSWGACTTCNGFHVDLWYETFAALTGCDPTAGGCNPGVIPVKISDPVPCPTTTPKIYYRDSQSFFQLFQVTGLGAGFKSASVANAAATFRQQTNTIGGILLALDATPTSTLPGSIAIVIEDLDGRTYTCNVPAGAAGSSTPCTGGGAGSFSAGLGSTVTTNPATTTTSTAATTTDASQPATTTSTDASQPATTTTTTTVTAASTTSTAPAVSDCEALRPVSPVVQEGVTKDYAAYKRCKLAQQSGWPPAPVAGFVPEYGQCGIGGQMPLAGIVCETGTVCCQQSSEHAQCADPADTTVQCIAQLVTG